MNSTAKANKRYSPTRFRELGYRKDFPNCWRVVDVESNQSVGPQYRTKAELLAALTRYASDSWGIES